MRYSRALVVTNPTSGRGRGERLGESVAEELRRLGLDVRVLVTGNPKETRREVAAAIAEGRDVVVAVGGDGTLRSIIAPLQDTNVPVLPIPAGTSNLIVQHLEIPARVKPALKLLETGVERKVDVAHLDGRPFLLAAGFGLATDVIRDADDELKRYLGPLAYLWSLLRNLARRRVIVEMRLDGGAVVRHRAKLVLIANCAETLGQVDIIPNAAMDDGYVDVAVFHFAHFWQFLRLVGYLVTARWRRAREAVFYRARGVEVWIRPPMPIQIDGDIFGARSYFKIGMRPGALTVLAPKSKEPRVPREWLTEVEKQLERLRNGSAQTPAEIVRALWEEHVAKPIRGRNGAVEGRKESPSDVERTG